MIKRQAIEIISNYIKSSSPHRNVLIVDGVRQVGKTTAIHQALQSSEIPFLEINLEKQKRLLTSIDQSAEFSDFNELLEREFGFRAGQGTVLFIDEANESAVLGSFVRQMKEDWTNQSVILSGSMMQRLFRENMRVPVGRFDLITVSPFSFSEFLKANEEIKSQLTKYALADFITDPGKLKHTSPQHHQSLLELLDHYLTCGGVPDITYEYLENSGKTPIHNSHIEYLSILKDDFLRLFPVEYQNLFDRAVTSIANLLGQPYNKSALVRNNNRLADNILSVFDKWHFSHRISQMTHQSTVSNKLHPKRYLFDCGLAKTKREMGFPPIRLLETLNAQLREPLGGLIEQIVCQELIFTHKDLCGFRDANYEIDFIVKWNDDIIPIECKASLKPNSNQYRSLDLYQKKYGNKKAVLISLAPFSIVKREGYSIYHIPVYALSCWKEILEF